MKVTILFIILSACCPVFAQMGFTCTNPIPLTFPVDLSDSTANYGDTYDTIQDSGCDAVPATTNFFAGNDVFYSYTAMASGIATLVLDSNFGTVGASIFVYAGCPGTGTCVAGSASNISGSLVRQVTFDVVSGQLYTVVLSSGSTPSYGYTLKGQLNSCPELTPSGITKTSASATQISLNWNNTAAMKWEVAIIPHGNGIDLPEPGTPTFFTTTNSINVSLPTPITSNQSMVCFVRAYCSDTLHSSWVREIITATFCDTAQCPYIFRLEDTAGDGWMMSSVNISQPDTVSQNIQLPPSAGAGPMDFPILLCDGKPFTVSAGYFMSSPECRMTILNPSGQVIYTLPQTGLPGMGTVLYNGIADCSGPTCNVTLSNVAAASNAIGSATLSWSDPSGDSWDIFIAPSSDAAPAETTPPTYGAVTSNPFTVSGLVEDIDYRACVRTHCDIPSEWKCAQVAIKGTCSKPGGTSVSNLWNPTSARLKWVPASATDTQWEILLIPGLSDPAPPAANPQGGILFSVSSEQLVATNPHAYDVQILSKLTRYHYYIRTVCSDGSKSNWTSPKVFDTVGCLDSNCQYDVEITDTTGWGWYDGRMEIRQNGIPVLMLPSFPPGFSYTIPLPLCDDVPAEVYWGTAGSYPQGLGIRITDPSGNTIYSKEPGTGTPQTSLFSWIPNCFGTEPEPCPGPPSNLSVSDTTASGATLHWQQVDYPQQWEVYVVEMGGAPPSNDAPVSNTAPHYVTASKDFVVSGLDPSTDYQFYVRAICLSDFTSVWTEADVFTTIPSDDRIKVIVFVDLNGNGTREENEYFAAPGQFKYRKNNNGPFDIAVNSEETLTLYGDSNDTYDITYEIFPEYAAYYGNISVFEDVTLQTGSGTQTLYIPLTVIQPYSDSAIAVTGLSTGGAYNDYLIIENKGLIPVSGEVQITRIPWVSTIYIPPGVTVTNAGYNFPISTIMPGQSVRHIAGYYMDLGVGWTPESKETHTSTFVSSGQDLLAENDAASVKDIFIMSFMAPVTNHNYEHHGTTIDLNDFGANGTLRYSINFNNPSDVAVFRAHIEEDLDPKLDPSTVRMVDASHPYTFFRSGNNLKWEFENIDLDQMGSGINPQHGFVTFDVKPYPGLEVGDVISNHADIYLDAHPVISTGVFNTLFIDALTLPESGRNMATIFPNPADHTVTISLIGKENMISVKIFDLLGKEIRHFDNLNSSKQDFDVANLPNGLYLLEIATDDDQRIVTRKLSIK